MPPQPVVHTPSFMPSVYPYEITAVLSTESLWSTLRLPYYQAFEHQGKLHFADTTVLDVGQKRTSHNPEPLNKHTASPLKVTKKL